MAITKELARRFDAILNSPSLVVVPVGDPERTDRGILSAGGLASGPLKAAVTRAFSAVVIAAALVTALPAHAGGVGYDAGVYGQAQRQVMQQGTATRMMVINVRPVKIEVEQQAQSSGMGHAVTAGGGAVGAIIGNQFGKTSGGKQIGSILGGLAGLVAGHMANSAMQGAQEATQVDGAEITMVNPVNNQVFAVTQAGSQTFTPGEQVLLVLTGGTARVVPDRSQQLQNTRPMQDGGMQQRMERQAQPVFGESGMGHAAVPYGQGLEQNVASIVRTAAGMGVQVDANKVAKLLETGVGERDGQFVGRVVGVDPERGLVFQATGRGMGMVHSMDALSHVPAIGEVATIRMQDGRGMVNDRPGRNVAMGFGR